MRVAIVTARFPVSSETFIRNIASGLLRRGHDVEILALAPGTDGDPRSDDCTPEEFAARSAEWLRSGARLVGGCCGTRPEHLAAVRRTLDR